MTVKCAHARSLVTWLKLDLVPAPLAVLFLKAPTEVEDLRQNPLNSGASPLRVLTRNHHATFSVISGFTEVGKTPTHLRLLELLNGVRRLCLALLGGRPRLGR